MKKRFLAIFLSLCMCVSLFPVTAFAEETEMGADISIGAESVEPEPAEGEGETAGDSEAAETVDETEAPTERAELPSVEAGEEGFELSSSGIVASGNCGAQGDNATWTLDADGVLTISGTGAMADYEEDDSAPYSSRNTSVKSVIIESGVTSIGNYAFENYFINLTSIEISNSVTSIGVKAFSDCSSLTSVTIPDSVTRIGNGAFVECSSLTSIVIPNSVTSMGNAAFYKCTGLTSVTIFANITSINDRAFLDCYRLTSVTIPDSVTRIGKDTFSDCDGLTSVTIPEGVTEIDSSAFYDCNSLTSVTILGNVTSIGEIAFSGCNKLKDVFILGNVTSIGNSAFSGCSSLTSIEIPDGLTSIGRRAFSDCSSMTSVTIPDSVTSIGDDAFSGCSNLADVYYLGTQEQWDSVSMGSSNTALLNADIHVVEKSNIVASGTCGAQGDNVTWMLDSDGVLTISGEGAMANYSWSGNTAPWYEQSDAVKSVIIESGVTSIGNYAFFDCNNLTSITIPESVTSIGDYAFSSCNRLTSVSIPESVTRIGACAFEECSMLAALDLPDSIVSIGEYAFSGVKISSLRIPAQLEEIGAGAFARCDNLELITVSEDNVNFTAENGTVLYNTDKTTLYLWLKASGNIIIPESVTSIGGGAFYGCSNLENVNIPENVTSIGEAAFAGCRSLTSIDIPDGVTSIGTGTFSGCSSLTSVTIPEGVTSIGNAAFYYCSSLTSVTIPEGVTSIGSSAFSGCRSLASVTIPDGVTSIGDSAFTYCSSLTSVTIPEGVTSIGAGTFYGCSSLTSITIPEGVTSIDRFAFDGCSSLTSITIPEGVTSIGSWAFYNCSGLTSVIIPESVTSIGNSAFSDCDSLTDVYFNGTQEQWDSISIESGNTPLTNATLHTAKIGTCGAQGDNVKWKLYPDGTLVISGTGAMADYTSGGSVLPTSGVRSIVIEDGVTSIGDNAFFAFDYGSQLTSVSIADSVTRIGDGAFYGCNELSTVNLPDSIVSIGEYAFSGVKISSLRIPAQLEEIGAGAFERCDNLELITVSEDNVNFAVENDTAVYSADKTKLYFWANASGNAVIPDSVTEIAEGAFRFCNGLTGVVIPDGVTDISSFMFFYCSNLENVNIPENVTSIGNAAFYNCSSLTGITIPEGVMSIGTAAFYNCSSLTSITIPEGVMSIGSSAFSGCSSLTSVTIPEGVTSVGDYTFRNCSSLTSIEIPDGVTSIGAHAFSSCSNLADVYYLGTQEQWDRISIEIGNTPLTNATLHTAVGGYCGAQGENLVWIFTPDRRLIIKGTGAMADYSSSNLAPWVDYITPHNNVHDPNDKNFESVSVIIEPGVTSIGRYAFSTDWSNTITSVSIPQTVTEIRESAFRRAYNIMDVYYSGFYSDWQKIEIGDDNENIGEHGTLHADAGGYCGAEGNNLRWVLSEDGTLTISGSGAMADYSNSYENMDAHAPWEQAQYNSSYGSRYVTRVVIEDGVTSIGTAAFAGLHYLERVSMADSVVSIGRMAFSNSNSLAELELSAGLKTIDSDAFAYCSNLTSITIPVSVTSVGSYAFSGCSGLTSVTIPETVTEIGSYAFNNCISLESINLPDSITQLNDYIFFNCKNLSSVELPQNLQSIGEGTFDNCCALTEINIPEAVKTISSYAFANCTSLSSVNIPRYVTKIRTGAFSGCTSLTSFALDPLHEVYAADAQGAIYSKDMIDLVICPAGLEGEFKIPDTVQRINPSAFSGCAKLTSVKIPKSVVSVSEGAFAACSALSDVYYYGTKDQWNKINVASGNAALFDAEVHFVKDDSCGAEGSNVTWYMDGTRLYITGTGDMRDYSPTNPAPWSEENVTMIIIGTGVTSIGDYAFANLSSAASSTVSADVTHIGEGAFENCSALKAAIISANVTEIEPGAYAGCSSLKRFVVNSANPSYSVDENGILYNKDFTEVVAVPGGISGDVVMRDTVRVIGEKAFADCDGITSVVIPQRVEKVEESAFSGCDSLAEITIMNKNIVIEDFAFEECFAIEKLSFPGDWSEFYNDNISFIGNDMLFAADFETIEVPSLGTSVSGSITPACTASDTAFIELIQDGVTKYSVTANGADYSIADVAAGEYQLKVTRSGYVTVNETVTVADADVTENIELVNKNDCAAVRAAALALQEQIGVVIKLEIPASVLADEGAYAVLGIDGVTDTYPEVRIMLNSVTPDANGRYPFEYRVHAKQVDDKISVRIYNSDGEQLPLLYGSSKSELEGNVFKYAAADYLNNHLNDSDPKLAALCRALKDYGAAARIYFGYNAAGAAIQGDLSGVNETVLGGFARQLTPATVDGISISAANLQLTSMTKINVKFTCKSGDISGYTFLVDNKPVTPVYDGSRYVIDIDNIHAKFLDVTHTISVTDGTNTQTLSYSPMSYAYAKVNDSDATLANLVRTLYLYGQAAKIYFGV